MEDGSQARGITEKLDSLLKLTPGNVVLWVLLGATAVFFLYLTLSGPVQGWSSRRKQNKR